MSLTDGRSKMSKSDPNDNSRINLLDAPELVRKKIKRAKTDATKGLTFDDPERPEASNLLGLYALLSGRSRAAAAEECGQMGWGQFKGMLSEVVVDALHPIQQRYGELMADPAALGRCLKPGAAAGGRGGPGLPGAGAHSLGADKPVMIPHLSSFHRKISAPRVHFLKRILYDSIQKNSVRLFTCP